MARGVCGIALGLGAALAWLVPATAAAQPAAAERTRLCRPGTPEHRDADRRLAALRAAITTLAPDADVAPIRDQLSELASSECFELAAHSSRLPEARDALTIRHWWDVGGDAYLASMLELPRAYDEHSHPTGRPQLVVPPDERHSLTLDTTPHHPLAALLCHALDTSCGAETAGWRIRAERRFRAFAAEDELRYTGNGEPTRPQRRDACDAPAATHTSAARRFDDWRACVDASRPTEPALPLGRFRAPKSGWMVLRGRRGHYAFCDEVRAYDLATGAAYVAQSCSGLALRQDGSVDGAATDAARGQQVRSGRVPVDALREAALMTMLADAVDDTVFDNAQFETLPAGVDMVWDPSSFGGLGMRGWVSSAQTQLAWEWIDGGRVAASGSLTWPDSARAGQTHADELWEVAEGGLVGGCAPAVLPTRVPLAPPGPSASRLDADPAARSQVEVGLWGSLVAQARPLACPQPSEPGPRTAPGPVSSPGTPPPQAR